MSTNVTNTLSPVLPPALDTTTALAMVQITAIVVVMATLFTGGILSKFLSSTIQENHIPKQSLWLQLLGKNQQYEHEKGYYPFINKFAENNCHRESVLF